jgi:lipopolysaccharide transport system permease protein
MVGHAPLISKVYFPRIILPLSTVASALLDCGIALVLLLVLLPIYGNLPTARVVLVPIWLVLVLLLASGLGLLAGALSVTYRDVQHIIPVLVPLLMYASPVGYGMTAVPQRLQTVFWFNPLTGVIEAFRWSVLGSGQPAWRWLAYDALVGISVFMIGVVVFEQTQRRFADVI